MSLDLYSSEIQQLEAKIKQLKNKKSEIEKVQQEKMKDSCDINKNMLIMKSWVEEILDLNESCNFKYAYLVPFFETTYNLLKIQQEQINELNYKLKCIKK